MSTPAFRDATEPGRAPAAAPRPRFTLADVLAAYVGWVIRHARAVLAAVLLGTALLGVAAMRLRVEVDIDRLLPQSHPSVQASKDVYRVFGDYIPVVVGLFPRGGDVFTPSFLRKVAEVHDRLSRLPGVEPALLHSLAAPGIMDAVGSDDGVEVRPLMEVVPRDDQEARALRERVFANPSYVGTLVAADGSATALELSVHPMPAEQIETALRAALAQSADGSFEYAIAGPVIYVSQLSTYTTRVMYLFPLALLVIGLVHYHAFRTLQALFLPLLTGLLAVVWAVGLMGAIGVPLDLFNVSTPILILAVAAGHAVQILKRFYEEYEGSRDVGAAIVESLVRTGPVMLAAGTVAALAFCSLATFPMATIRTFGLFTGFGILSALAIELTIIPAVRALLPPPRAREREREAAAHPWIDAVLTAVGHTMRGRGPRWTLLAAGITLLVSGLLATRIEVDTSAKRQFADDAPVRRDDALLNARFAGTNTLDLLVEGDADGALEEPALIAAVDRLERALEAEPNVGKAFSYVDFLGVVHRALGADRGDTTDLPGTRGLVAQELFLISAMGGVDETSLRLDPSHRIAVVRVLAHEDRARYGRQLIARARRLVATTFPPGYQVRYGGTLATTAALTDVMVEGKLRNIVQVAAITFGVTSLLLRSLIGGLLATIPLTLTVALNFAAMGLLGVPLDAATATISAISVGIGVDYAIYFLLRAKEELASGAPLPVAIHRALMTSGKAVVFVSSAIALGYAMLCISGFGLHVQLGGLVALAMVTSAAGTLTLLPALIALLRPAFLTPARSA